MSVANTSDPKRLSFLMNRRVPWSATIQVLLVILFTGFSEAAAQDEFIFDADDQFQLLEPHGFGAVKNSRQPDPDVLGAEGRGDYSLYLNSFSLVTPEEDLFGLWTIFRVTQVMCRSLYRGEKSLVEAAPKGFVIAGDDIHTLGRERPGWNGNWFAITKTGDSELDAAGGHPFWYVRYNDEGGLHSCGVELGSPTLKKEGAEDDAKRASVVRFLYVGVPQIFFGIITEPAFAGFYPLDPANVITMMSPCGGAWCRISTNYDFNPGQWYVTSTVVFDAPLGLERGR
ncbi:hypothetical protein [uncultured Roseibium sp.]|uniref:hypothetical protein n=1 Tax=uncultured Roseibium sp. TaxID=1936171 RepID=UPI002604F9CE|nr:hypothetical protein [uncultured Roseibium sp.]